MNVIAFQFETAPTSNDDQVRPLIDDIDVLHTLGDGSLGLDPPEFFSQPALGREGKLLIGRCSCGVVGCGDVQVDIAVEDQSVIWRTPSLTYRFEYNQYTSDFERASKNTEWESVGRTAERLVESIDFTNLTERGYKFEWASTRIARGRVTLSFTNEGTQRLFEVGWDTQHADDAARQVRRWVSEYA